MNLPAPDSVLFSFKAAAADPDTVHFRFPESIHDGLQMNFPVLQILDLIEENVTLLFGRIDSHHFRIEFENESKDWPL